MAGKKGQTPVMKQFWNAKKKHPDAVMLFRMGDFYETFDDDAILASEILGIALTKRANGAASTVPLAGFPYHSLEQYLHKLLKAGHRVAICEQVEDPKKAKGIVKREVVEVLSPGTALTEKYLDHSQNNFLASVIFNNNKFALSILDYSTGEFFGGEWEENSLLHLLHRYSVSEVIVPESQKDTLTNLLQNNQCFISTIPDWVAEIETAYDILIEQFNTQSLKGFGLENRDLLVSASACALHYVNQNFQNKSTHITSFFLIQEDGYMGVDAYTLQNLEIFRSLSSHDLYGTLISVMDKTVTSAGSRMLKQWLSQPLSDVGKIEKRLMRVEECFSDFEIKDGIRSSLKQVSDITRIMARLSTHKAHPKDIINLGNSLAQIKNIKHIIGGDSSSLNKLISKSKNTTEIENIIMKTLKEDPPVNISKGGYIADGFSKKLDEYRKLSTNASDWLAKMQVEEQQKTGIPSLKIGYNRVFGYYIDVTKTHIDKIPEYYIRKQTLTNSERYFTEELKVYEEKILSAEEKIVELEANILSELIQQIMLQIIPIQQNSEILSKFDIASALAEVAVSNEYVKPKMSQKPVLEIRDSRHPVVETLLPIGEDFIPNDVKLDSKTNQIVLITGPNMAGKSTYLRQIGLIVLMAQIGSFVPASKANIGIVDKLFTRVGASDNLARGESTFLVEMNETANILNNATKKSLILLDEIGRGTSTYDGLSIAWSVVEYLHNKSEIQARTIFATHYHELVELVENLDRGVNLNVAVQEHEDNVVFLRKIIEGGADKSYGIHVAGMAGLPISVINRATSILSELSKDKFHLPTVSHEIEEISQMDLFKEEELKIRKKLNEVNINTLTPLEALEKLDELKKSIDEK